MGNFSRDTFDKLKHYVSVRLQQGVPIVDADWNEAFDIRKYELQAFLKWFVGNGVPEGNNGFAIVPAISVGNDFIITGGDGTTDGAGRCLVEGWDVIIEDDLQYSEQPLYNNDVLATGWGVQPVLPLTTPEADRTDTVYLDVWEREVDGAEDPDHLINPAIGIETSVRLKREWVVRVTEDAIAPPNPPTEGHVFYPLASLTRTAGEDPILPEQIIDLRLELATISNHDLQQVAADAFGADYTLNHDSQPDLKMSLREAINALLRGGLPTTPELPLTTEEADTNRNPTVLADSNGDIWVFWDSRRDNKNDIWYKRYDRASDTWQIDQTVSDGSDNDFGPAAIEDSNGDIWVFWTRSDSRGGSSINNIWYRRYVRDDGQWRHEEHLTEGFDPDNEPLAVEDGNGDVWVFWRRFESRNGSNTNKIWYRRYDLDGGGWQDPQLLNPKPRTEDTHLYDDTKHIAIVDGDGGVWVFWASRTENDNTTTRYILYSRYDLDSGGWQELDYVTSDDGYPIPVADSNGNVWVFWTSDRSGNNDIWYRCYNLVPLPHGVGEVYTQLTDDTATQYSLFAMEDSRMDLWLFYRANSNIFYKRFTPSGWTQAVQVTTTSDAGEAAQVVAVEDSEGDIWVVGTKLVFESVYDIWYKKLTPSI
ncbi:hypothetical protein KFU94_07900 [Chloroflexi bacterium TSY]|nr:hypothetical protein [Chloroflexi bacterium TSY]